MVIRFVLLSALICLSVAQLDLQVHHIILNDANLIETSRGYAINAPALLTKNWKAVSVNGDDVKIYTPSCQQLSMSKQDLMGSQDVLNSAKQSLYSAESGYNQVNDQTARFASTKFSSHSSTGTSRNLGMSNFNSNGITMTRYNDNNMAIFKSGGLPDGIIHVFISNDLVTFVYQDGRVLMKPAACMSPVEQQLVQQLRAEIQETKRKFDNDMQQFQKNMQNMQRNMQMNMQNMQQGLSNMFQPGFPFQNQPRPANGMYQGNGFTGFPSIHNINNAFPSGGATAYSQAGIGAQPAASAGSWPFGQNNSPFFPSFPFGRK